LPAFALMAGDVAVANNGSAARCFRNDRRIMGSDLTREELHPAFLFQQILVSLSLTDGLRLLARLWLTTGGPFDKKNSFCAEVADGAPGAQKYLNKIVDWSV